MFSTLHRIDWIFNCSRNGRRHDELVKFLHAFTINVIQTRRKMLSNEKSADASNDIDDDGIGRKKRMALLDLLLNTKINGKPLTDTYIREEVDNFMFAVRLFSYIQTSNKSNFSRLFWKKGS